VEEVAGSRPAGPTSNGALDAQFRRFLRTVALSLDPSAFGVP